MPAAAQERLCHVLPIVTDRALPLGCKATIKLHIPDRVGTLNSVKRWYYIVLAGLLLASAYVYLHRQELGLTGPRGLLSSDAPSADLASSASRLPLMKWQTIDRSSDGFRVEMPGDI